MKSIPFLHGALAFEPARIGGVALNQGSRSEANLDTFDG